jgi:hypothetical protein
MGDNQTTQTTTSGSSNPAVNSTLTKLLGGVNTAFDAGPKVFDQSLYAGVSPTTTGAWTNSLNAANNPDYLSGVTGALKSTANTAAGLDYGTNDPGYSALRSKLQNDVTTGVNSSFANSGLFGSDSNQKGLASGLTDSLGALDYQNFQNDQQRQQQAITDLPGLFSALQAPSATAGAVGAAQDANAQSTLSGNADLFDRKNNALADLISRLTGSVNGIAGSGGTTSTTSQPGTPWWQSVLGAGIALA